MVYACVSLINWSDPVNSQCGVGVAGVLLIGLNLAAGLAVSSLVVDFNASTLQVRAHPPTPDATSAIVDFIETGTKKKKKKNSNSV